MTDSTDLLTVSLRAYREGYKAALVTVALAFGIAPQAISWQEPADDALEIPAHENAALPRSAAWEEP